MGRRRRARRLPAEQLAAAGELPGRAAAEPGRGGLLSAGPGRAAAAMAKGARARRGEAAGPGVAAGSPRRGARRRSGLPAAAGRPGRGGSSREVPAGLLPRAVCAARREGAGPPRLGLPGAASPLNMAQAAAGRR